MKKILFVCERNVVLGPAAEAIFVHMGVSLLSSWAVSSAGWGQSLDINNQDSIIIQNILQKQAVPFKIKGRQILIKDDITSSEMVLCFEQKSLDTVHNTCHGHQQDTCVFCQKHVKMMSDFYPGSPIKEIPDPFYWKDSKSYEKCYWLIYKSVRELVKMLKEDKKSLKPKTSAINIPDKHIIQKFQEKTLESPETVMISLIPPVQAVVSITQYQFGQTFKLDTVDEPTFAEINEANDIINYQSEHQQRCSKDGNITSNLSICLSTDDWQYDKYDKLIFTLEPPQMSFNEEKIIHKGGDLFDEIKKLRMSWKLVK